MDQHATPPGNAAARVLKRDLFGTVSVIEGADGWSIRRDTTSARWWTGWLARWLAAREARALAAAAQLSAVPRLVSWDGRVLVRSWLDGLPMQEARPRDPGYFRGAMRLVRAMHTAGIVHNDLGKEPNWLVRGDGRAGVVDFQLAWAPRRRGRLFRLLGREDLRHALKHKRHYCPEALTTRERAILDRASLPARLWMATGKKVYLFVTRRLLGWADREGAGDRWRV